MSTALFLSPHLDDVAFSCGGTLSALAEHGWTVQLCTVFTVSVAAPTGFALACQTDKGLGPEVDYMQLRRAEDQRFAALAGVTHLLHLAYAEAPHRGYDSAAALFAGVHDHDQIWRAVSDALRGIVQELRPDLVFAPQGLGNHADHLQLIQALRAAQLPAPIGWYRDTPYAIRQPDARPSPLLPAGLREHGLGIDQQLGRKIAACAAYSTQIPFQFGGTERLGSALREFHAREAARLDLPGFVEALLLPPGIELGAWLSR